MHAFSIYLSPFKVPDFVEVIEFIHTEVRVLLIWVGMQGLEDAHHLPLGYIHVYVCVCMYVCACRRTLVTFEIESFLKE